MTFWCLRNAGTWAVIHHHLRHQARIEAGRDPDPTVAIIDSQCEDSAKRGQHRLGQGPVGFLLEVVKRPDRPWFVVLPKRHLVEIP
ncbi:MAG: hypothetical protein H6972_17235, partial [Gammaproteobacteria bacterium]|nr:hypothetical protein [Gammaproteobacteria bacterium]